MRNLILFLISLTSLSCANRQPDKKLIIGSWKMRNVVNSTGLNATDKVTFYENDSIYVDSLVDNKVNSQLKGKYVLDTESETLTTIINDETSSRSEVIKLTETEMELKDEKTEKIIGFIRF